ncbi:MAG: 23S rRNA (adenine(2503)-C(2))-methyltransferase RlmN [Sphaerochaeta sp.]|jgi:23S rRNA (adenine2503-C2)-methyltransferase|uniref:23S rRNA (adenine(2503)-C(2))-methyltransferase RlmN n=1 Tax=Sphaerochaeta sp. TaxID=1972642 RepID=UPI002FC763B1
MQQKTNLPLSLYGLDPDTLVEVLALPKRFYGKQIFNWLVKGVFSFDQMTDLPKNERERLSALMPSAASSTIQTTETDESGATKMGIQLYDGKVVECVLLVDKKGRHTACLSSQVGCAMGCTFCRTGTMGLLRNLSTEEIIEQYIHLLKVSDEPITHIVYMGMGEPLANISAVTRSIRYFHQTDTFNLSLRRITISTCGVVPGILKLAEQKLPVKLAVSLVTADNLQRSRIMPVNRSWDTNALKKALIHFQRVGGKRFTFEYCMLSGTNTDEVNAKKLASYVKDLDVVVNLIPWNPAEGLPYTTPTEEEIDRFTSYLDHMHVNYTRRRSRGREINGACGQLAVPLNKGLEYELMLDEQDD